MPRWLSYMCAWVVVLGIIILVIPRAHFLVWGTFFTLTLIAWASLAYYDRQQRKVELRMKYGPTPRKSVPMGTRVVSPGGYCSTEVVKGRVVGIASVHMVFHYIVLLDSPIETEYGTQGAITVLGSLLEGEGGT